jgi:gas vesicle protein
MCLDDDPIIERCKRRVVISAEREEVTAHGYPDKARMIDMERADILKIMVGFGAGAATALLLAPYSGEQTRSKITDTAADGAAQAKEYGESVRGALLDAVEHSKGDIARHREGLAQAIKRGSEEYRRIVGERAVS